MPVELLKEPEDEYLTDLEIKTLIANLSPADIFRLSQIAKKYVWGCLMDADDLLHEAIVATLSGKRKFPRNVVLVAFLAKTMKSISSNERRKTPEKITLGDDIDNDPFINVVAENIHLEIEAAANQEIDSIHELFKNDEDVTILLMAKCDGLNPNETCETAGWSHTRYDSTQKRLRRTLNQRFPKGRET